MKLFWPGAIVAGLVFGAIFLFCRQMDRYEHPYGVASNHKGKLDTNVYWLPNASNPPRIYTSPPETNRMGD